MSIVVRNNMPVLQTVNMVGKNSAAFGKSLLRVSSGMRINNASDDTSGYSISERMQVMMRGLDQDTRNAQTGNSLLKVAQGAVSSTVEILKTLKEKAINAANDTNTDADRAMIQKELDQAIDQINDNANVTFNGKLLMDGSKNAKTEGTFTALTNESLAKTTTGATRLVDLADRQDVNLGIQIGDTVSVSYVQNGKTYSTSFAVTSTSTLATIMLKAENIDRDTQTFADIANRSVMAVNGVTDPEKAKKDHDDEVAAAENALKNANKDYKDYYDGDYTTAVNNLAAAKTALANYYTAFDNLDSAFNKLTGSFYSLVGNYALNAHPGNPDGYKNWHTQHYETWIAAGEARTDFLNPYPKASELMSDFYLQKMVAGSTAEALYPNHPGYEDALKLREIMTNYVTKYNAFVNSNNNSETVSYETAFISDVALKQNAFNTAQSTLKDLQEKVDKAQAHLDSLIAPEILSGPKIGLDYYGNVQTTADLGSALTITAMNVGTEGQIAGFTISVSGVDGNIKKSVNAVLDDWNETIRAQNARDEDDSLILQTGTRPSQAVKVQITDMRAEALGLQGNDGSTISVATQEKANAAINAIDNALKKAIEQQTTIGAMGSRLGYTSSNLQVASENVQASGSTIRDADMAKEVTTHTKDRVLLRSSQMLLAQSNHRSYDVLSLLR